MYKFITLDYGVKETEEKCPDYNIENVIQFHTHAQKLFPWSSSTCTDLLTAGSTE